MANNNTKAPAKWTVMFYMAANDRISKNAAVEFLDELDNLGKELDASPNINQVNMLLQVYMDWNTEKEQPAQYRTRRYRLKTNFLLERNRPDMKQLKSNVSMGTEASLTEFIKWCKKNYKAEKYLLLLWGHGTGSGLFAVEIEDAHTELLKKRPDFTLTDPNTGRRVSIQELLAPDSAYFNNPSKEVSLRITYTDENNRLVTDILTATMQAFEIFKTCKYELQTNNPSTLNQLKSYITSRLNLDGLVGRELNKSLEKSFGKNGSNLNLLVVLGCCMQMVEFGYEIRKHCNFYVASEELIFFEGYNYFDTFKTLIDDPDLNERKLGTTLIQQTPEKDFYTRENESYLAISCVDLRQNDELFDRINKIAGVIKNNYDELHPVIRKSRVKCSHFGERAYRSSFIDLIWFFTKLNEELAANNLFTDLQKAIEKLILFVSKEYIVINYIGTRKEPKPDQPIRSLGGHGVAIYFPSSFEDHANNEERGKYFDKKETEYVNLFSEKNSWNDLIFEYIKRVRGKKSSSVIQNIQNARTLNLLNENDRLKQLIKQYL